MMRSQVSAHAADKLMKAASKDVKEEQIGGDAHEKGELLPYEAFSNFQSDAGGSLHGGDGLKGSSADTKPTEPSVMATPNMVVKMAAAAPATSNGEPLRVLIPSATATQGATAQVQVPQMMQVQLAPTYAQPAGGSAAAMQAPNVLQTPVLQSMARAPFSQAQVPQMTQSSLVPVYAQPPAASQSGWSSTQPLPAAFSHGQNVAAVVVPQQPSSAAVSAFPQAAVPPPVLAVSPPLPLQLPAATAAAVP